MIKDNNGFNGYLNDKYAKQIIDMHFEKKKIRCFNLDDAYFGIWHRVCGEVDINFFRIEKVKWLLFI